MMTHFIEHWKRGLLVIFSTLVPINVCYAIFDKLDPYVYGRVLYDSNVFRVSGDQEAIAILGDDNRDDTIGYLGAGFEADYRISRQHLLVDLDVERAEYDEFSQLDHTRVRGRGGWGWSIGSNWNGELGYRYTRRLSSFNQLNVPEKDMRTEQIGYFNAGYQIHPDWKLVAGVSQTDVSYQDRDNLERDTFSSLFEVQYRNTRNTRVGVRTRFSNNDLQDGIDINNNTISNDYDELEISGVFYWEGTGKSSLEARWGYTDLSYDELDDRDFQGSTGRLTYFWVPTGKTRIDFSVWRETDSLGDEISSYVLSKGISARPEWRFSPKLSFKGEALFQNEDYKGENDIRAALGGQRRDDDTYIFRIAANYKPVKKLSLSLGYRRENRDSSIGSNDFDSKQVEGRIQYDF